MKKSKKFLVKKSSKKTSKKTSISSPKIAKNSGPKHIELKGFLSFFVLHHLNSGTKSGDELAKLIGDRKSGKLNPGTIYPALKRLRKLKLIAYKRIGRKKLYSLTSSGKIELNALYSAFGWLFQGLKSKVHKD